MKKFTVRHRTEPSTSKGFVIEARNLKHAKEIVGDFTPFGGVDFIVTPKK